MNPLIYVLQGETVFYGNTVNTVGNIFKLKKNIANELVLNSFLVMSDRGAS